MNKSFILFLIGGMFFLGWTACGNKSESGHGHEHGAATDQNGPEYTSAYICPMHCEGSGSAEPGKCPTCGMDYVENKNAAAEETEQQPAEDQSDSSDQMEHGDGHEHMH